MGVTLYLFMFLCLTKTLVCVHVCDCLYMWTRAHMLVCTCVYSAYPVFGACLLGQHHTAQGLGPTKAHYSQPCMAQGKSCLEPQKHVWMTSDTAVFESTAKRC